MVQVRVAPRPTGSAVHWNLLACTVTTALCLPPQYLESERASARGHKLHTVAALPDAASGPPAAVLVWHHGIAEHIGRYREGERWHCRFVRRGSSLPECSLQQRSPAPNQPLPRSVHPPGRGRRCGVRRRRGGARPQRGRAGAGAVVPGGGGLPPANFRWLLPRCLACSAQVGAAAAHLATLPLPLPLPNRRWTSCWRWGATRGRMWQRASQAPRPRPSSWLATRWAA